MDRKKIEEALLAKTKDNNGRLFITCNDAIEISGKLNVKPGEIGKLCNELKIKISHCRLGCF
jgi:hypothetical protein